MFLDDVDGLVIFVGEIVFPCSPWYVPYVACWRIISALFPRISDLSQLPPFSIIIYNLI
jgi:hypothetical protein